VVFPDGWPPDAWRFVDDCGQRTELFGKTAACTQVHIHHLYGFFDFKHAFRNISGVGGVQFRMTTTTIAFRL